jgi:FkbH-like protein
MTEPATLDDRDVQTRLQEILRALDQRPGMAAYAQAARQVRPLTDGLRCVRISLLATFTVEPLVPFLEIETARAGFQASIYTAPFNVVRQELLDPESGCHRHGPDVVFVAQLLDDVSPPLANDYLSLDAEQIEQHIEEIASETASAVAEFRVHSQAAVVVCNFPLPRHPLLGIGEPNDPASQTEAIRGLNRRLAEAIRGIPDAYVLDFDRLLAEVGYRSWQNQTWYLGRAPLSPDVLLLLAQTQAALLRGLLGRPRKCLVVDLDNTLWGGVVGEEGLPGIKLGHAYPGNAYRDLQRYLLQLHRRGVLLAINSKNNPAEVDEVLTSHPDMILRREHFASMRVNWSSKVDNMQEIAEELNIGLESLVYLDDHPAECELMRRALPEVLTLQACDERGRPDPIGAMRLLQEGRPFDKLLLTAEDRRRNELYQQQVARRELQHGSVSLEEYLCELETTVAIGPVDAFALPRVADLVQRTNQFNLTTRRHSAARLEAMIADPNWGVFALALRDRLGDSGVVGVALVCLEGSLAVVDTFLLSCRVIGRRAETALLCHVAEWARQHGARALVGEFLPTAKNAPAADFYPRHGFEQARATGEGGGLWQFVLGEKDVEWPDCIRLAPESKNHT